MNQRRAVIGSVLLLGILLIGGTGYAEVTPGRAAFSESIASLRAAAKEASADRQADAVILLDEVHFKVRGPLVVETVHHRIIKVQTEAGASNWGRFGRGWAPWYQNRPVLEARVLDPSGAFHTLDPSTIEVVTQPQGNDHTYSDWRSLRAPLPAVHVGAIIETVTRVESTRPFAQSGDRTQRYLGSTVPTLRSHVTIESDHALKTLVLGVPKATFKKRRKGKKYSYSLDLTRLEPFEYEKNLPYDIARAPAIAFSTGSSWQAAAREYAGLVDQQIAKGGLPKEALPKRQTSRKATISAALASLHRRVRYTGLEFGENAMVPWTPKESWTRQYGDCKDKATMLVAMLRSAGIEAHVALLRSGFHFDVTQETPGLGGFNHAIVYVPKSSRSDEEYWIDATVELAALGQLPYEIQGRWALVASKSTKALTKIPNTAAQDNRVEEARTVVLPSYGKGTVSERTEYFGTQEIQARYRYRDQAPDKLRKDMEEYVAGHYKAPSLVKVHTSAPADLKAPLTLDLLTGEAAVTYAGTHEAGVYIYRGDLFDLASYQLTNVATEKPHLRSRIPARTQPLRVYPWTKEWRYRIEHPKGFEVKTLPRDQTRMLGALHYRQTFRAKEDHLEAVFTVTQKHTILTAAQTNETRKKIAELLDSDVLLLRMHHDAMGLWDMGKERKAIRSLQDAIRSARSEDERATEQARLARLLDEVGLSLDAKKLAEEASKAPNRSLLLAETAAIAALTSSFGRDSADDATPLDAIPHFTRALALAPDRSELMASLARLLLRDAAPGEESEEVSRAVDLMREAERVSPGVHTGLLVRALLVAGRYEELERLAEASDTHSEFTSARIVARYFTRGESAMLTTAKERDVTISDLYNAMYDLAFVRAYPAVQSLRALAGPPEAQRPIVGLLAGTRPREAVSVKSPTQALVLRAFNDIIAGREPRDQTPSSATSKERWSALRVVVEGLRSQLPSRIRHSDHIVQDLLANGLRIVRTDSAGPWTRVQVHTRDEHSVLSLFLSGRGAKAKLVASSWYPAPLLADVLASPARVRDRNSKKIAEWLKPLWAAENAKLFESLTPWGRLVPSLQQSRDPRRWLWQLAAQGLGSADVDVEPHLEACFATGNLFCLEGLAHHYSILGDHKRALATYDRIPRVGLSAAEIEGLETRRVQHLLGVGEADKALALGEELLKSPTLPEHFREFLLPRIAHALLLLNRAEEGQERLRAAASDEMSLSLNNMGWFALFVPNNPKLEEVIEEVSDGPRSVNSLHTLAALLAASGDNHKAMETIAEAQDFRGSIEALDWVVYGRVAANLGFYKSAREAYDRVMEGATQGSLLGDPLSTAKLADIWSKELPQQ